MRCRKLIRLVLKCERKDHLDCPGPGKEAGRAGGKQARPRARVYVTQRLSDLKCRISLHMELYLSLLNRRHGKYS